MAHKVLVEREVHDARARLPGNVRQRIKRAIDALTGEPRPSDSQPLNVTGLDVPAGIEVRRLRLDRWRIIYAVNDEEAWVWILAIRRRPPYDYEDLQKLVGRLS